MKWGVVAAIVAGCSKPETTTTTCEAVGDRAVELIAGLEATTRKALEEWSRGRVVEECKKHPFGAHEFACARRAADLRALSNCGLYALSDALPPELSCPPGTSPGLPVDEGKARLVACEQIGLRGKRHGPAARYLDDSTVIAQLTFADGVLDGPVVLHDTITGSYKAGKRHGTWALSDDDSGTKIVVELADGVAHGAYSRSEAGEEVTGAYARNKRTAAWTYRTPYGSARGSYADDRRTGEWVFAYPSSAAAARGKYKAGKRQPGWKFFAPDGAAMTEKAALAIEWLAAALADDGSTDRAVVHAFMTAH